MNNLIEVIRFFSEGKTKFPVLSYIDDKKATKEELAKFKNYFQILDLSKLEVEVPKLLAEVEKYKSSLCFYPNGAKNKEEIEKISWHFVDIDESGGG